MADVPPKDDQLIRTYAGDMAVASQGGSPELTTVSEHDKILAKVETKAPEMPPASVPAPVTAASTPSKAVETPTVPVEGWNDKVRAATLERLHAQIERDEEQGVHRITETRHAILPGDVEGGEPLRTYEGDVAEHVADTQASRLSILAAEQDSAGNPLTALAAPVVEKTVYYVVGVVLVLAGAGGALYAYLAYQAAHAPVVVEKPLSARIFFEEKELVPERGAPLASAIAASATRPLQTNSVRYLYSDSATTTREGLFVAANINAPNIFVRNIVGERSMVGILTAGSSEAPFFIMSVASYNETFAGMLSWERTMPTDLALYYPAWPAPAVPVATSTATSTRSTATTTPARPAEPIGFVDIIVTNHDTRAYKDAQGRIVFLYGYTDPSTLVIARSREAFAELAERLSNSRP